MVVVLPCSKKSWFQNLAWGLSALSLHVLYDCMTVSLVCMSVALRRTGDLSMVSQRLLLENTMIIKQIYIEKHYKIPSITISSITFYKNVS